MTPPAIASSRDLKEEEEVCAVELEVAEGATDVMDPTGGEKRGTTSLV